MANTGLAGAFAVKRPGWSDIGGWASPLQYNGIQLGDIDGDGQAELLVGGGENPRLAGASSGQSASSEGFARWWDSGSVFWESKLWGRHAPSGAAMSFVCGR